MSQVGPGSEPDNDSNDLIREEPAQPQHQIDLEILVQEYEQDKSDLVKGQAPKQINFSADNYTTVEKAQGNTLYNSDGKVETTIPTEYLNNLREYGFEVPTVCKDNTGEYLLLPSSQREPNFDANDTWKESGGYKLFKDNRFNKITTFPAVLKFLTKFINIEHPSSAGYYMATERAVRPLWERAIQQNEIRFADEEKVKHFTLGETTSMDLAPKAIKDELSAATWTASFSQKKTLFVKDGRLKLFDWGNDIAANWNITVLDIPEEIKPITAGGLDPKENFLMVGSNNTLYVIDPHSKPVKIVRKLEIPDMELHGVIHLKDDGAIVGGDKNGQIITIASNLHAFTNRREKLEQARTIQRLKNKKRIKEQNGEAAKKGPLHPELQGMADEIHAQFADDISKADSLEQIGKLRKEILTMRSEYASELKDTKMVDAIFGKIIEALKTKETELLSVKVDSEMQSVRALLGRIGSMSLPDLADARRRVDRLKDSVVASNLDPAIKHEITAISDTFAERAAEAIGNDEDMLIAQIESHVATVRTKLDSITKLSEFEIWKNTDYQAFLEALDDQMRIIPSSHQKVIAKIRQVQDQVRNLRKEYTKKFEEQYEDVRKKASTQTNIMVGLVSDRIDEFLESFEFEVHKKHFKNPEEAREWVERSPLYASVLAIITDLISRDQEKADNLAQRLKVEIAQLAYEVKQMKDSTLEEGTQRQMRNFGKIAFPIWEESGTEKEKPVNIELIFKVVDASGGKPENYMCELFYEVTDENGKVEEIPMNKEDVKKYGRYDERFHDEAYFESHIPLGRARKMLSAIKSMESARVDGVKAKFTEFQNRMRELNGKIGELKNTNSGDWSALKEERENLTKEYIGFLQESGIYGWYALKAFRKQYEAPVKGESTPGQGRVPEQETYWVRDEATEGYLEKFAQMAKLTLANREGLISLEGHAGTGKDVLVQMFAERTNRPLFSFDCSKWTTEFDLSQDVTLKSENGASFTQMVDSVVVKAMKTPGAILYFNEFNTLPLQAQTYLHSLFDAKRQITLKTSSSEIVKADKEMLICASMNPGYPGTNHPNPATRDRMIPIKLEFPEFKKADGTYGAGEALRVARSVRSLADLAIEPDMEENEFIKLWDNYINKGITNGNLTPERKFDLEVIFALITFGNNIREGFINKITNKSGRKVLTLSQSFSLRGMRRCAYILSHMDEEKKQDPNNAEKVAKDLIREFYSQYLFDEKEASEFENQLSLWTVQKPMRTSP